MIIEQSLPVKPDKQIHWYFELVPFFCTQTPFLQGFVCKLQKLSSISHLLPVNPDGHVQVALSSKKLFSQREPLNDGKQRHL